MELVRHAFTAPAYLQTTLDGIIKFVAGAFLIILIAAVTALVAGRSSR